MRRLTHTGRDWPGEEPYLPFSGAMLGPEEKLSCSD